MKVPIPNHIRLAYESSVDLEKDLRWNADLSQYEAPMSNGQWGVVGNAFFRSNEIKFFASGYASVMAGLKPVGRVIIPGPKHDQRMNFDSIRSYTEYSKDSLADAKGYWSEGEQVFTISPNLDSIHRKGDQSFNLKQLYLRSCTALGLDPENSSWFEVVGELETQAQGHDCFNAVITFALKLRGQEGTDFLRCWNDGDFEVCRREWPEAPDECYIGADTQFVPKTDL